MPRLRRSIAVRPACLPAFINGNQDHKRVGEEKFENKAESDHQVDEGQLDRIKPDCFAELSEP